MAKLDRKSLETLIFGEPGARRFTQDSPVLPDVWLRYGEKPGAAADLLLTPHRDSTVSRLAGQLMERLEAEQPRENDEGPRRSPDLAMNQSTVVARLTFEQLMRVALPLSEWWRKHVLGGKAGSRHPNFGMATSRRHLRDGLKRMETARRERRSVKRTPRRTGGHVWHEDEDLLWMVRLVGAMLVYRSERAPADDRALGPTTDEVTAQHAEIVGAFCDLMADLRPPLDGTSHLFLVSVNREAKPALERSVLAVKADAARRLFDVSSARLTWAIVDSGIDATHPAFRKRDAKGKQPAKAFEAPARKDKDRSSRWTNNTRVRQTYDFTRVRLIMNPMDDAADQLEELEGRLKKARGTEEARLKRQVEFWRAVVEDEEALSRAKALREGLNSGRSIDWSEMLELLRIPDHDYRPAVHDHGTHVAGILAADWKKSDKADTARRTEQDIEGVCPDINLIDLRVLDDFGLGDEFSVMAALQFVRWLNASQDAPVVHGVNLSLSIPHDVANYACGRTPVCEECERVVSSGVVVVAAAGNEGYIQFQTPTGQSEGYRSISITDPGNAEGVITVGATHRYHPHTYGVSYFSSRGPTGDGRMKPDLVAPGEKILAPVPEGMQVKDGTSMAAPHVSGAAALLMSRHLELIGRPAVVKHTLCETATDLGRERYFQGAGMLDALRALQHV